MRLACALVAGLAYARCGVDVDQLLGDFEREDRLDDRHRLAHGRGADLGLLELLPEASQPLRRQLPDAVAAEPGHDVVHPGPGVEVARRLREVRLRVQCPIGLDELAERDVVRDRGVTELLAPDPVGLEGCGVALAVKRSAAPLSALSPAELPLAVGLAADVHQSWPASIACRRSQLPGSVGWPGFRGRERGAFGSRARGVGRRVGVWSQPVILGDLDQQAARHRLERLQVAARGQQASRAFGLTSERVANRLSVDDPPDAFDMP